VVVLPLCLVGAHALAAVADYEADSAAGMRTVATKMGKRPAAIFAAVCL
jgi:4-hydroxybenzoate polyprenyltransferase